MGAANNLRFECHCGAVAGELHDVGPKQGDRYTCYCNDCRDFLRLMDRADALDSAGGCSVYQTRVGHLHIGKGLDDLACINLTGGQLLRWYCETCRTPLFNTMDNGRWPFLSMVQISIDEEARDRVLGPPRGSVFAKFATGPDVITPPVSAFTMIHRVIARLFADRFSGARKSFQLFDPTSGAPIAKPRMVEPEERAALR